MKALCGLTALMILAWDLSTLESILVCSVDLFDTALKEVNNSKRVPFTRGLLYGFRGVMSQFGCAICKGDTFF